MVFHAKCLEYPKRLGFSPVVNTKPMNTKELVRLLSGKMIVYVGQQDGFPLLVLHDGTKVLISRDEEMNGAGAIIEL